MNTVQKSMTNTVPKTMKQFQEMMAQICHDHVFTSPKRYAGESYDDYKDRRATDKRMLKNRKIYGIGQHYPIA